MNDEPALELRHAVEAGFIPPPDAYTEEGQPVWQVATLATFFGQTLAQLETELATLPDALWEGPVYRIH